MQAVAPKHKWQSKGYKSKIKASWNGGAIGLERQLWLHDGTQRQKQQHTPARVH